LASFFATVDGARTLSATMAKTRDGTSQDRLPEIALRIPGRWRGPRELARALPPGYRLEAGRLRLPEGRRIGVVAHPPDNEFPRIFRSSCRRTPPAQCLAAVRSYAVNMCLAGPGGSMTGALLMIQAAAAVIRAGGAGVFVDNSGAAYAADDWLRLADDPDDVDAFQAFVVTFANEKELWTIGMQVFGLRDGVVPRSGDDEADLHYLLSFLGYTLAPAAPIVDGDLAGDDMVPQFRVLKEGFSPVPSGSPLHNPYGRWRLVPL
jgi:hypothetical protein